MKLSYPEIREQRLAAIRAALAAVLPPGTREIVFEVGCGHGHFLAAYAAAFPQRFCIGVDRDSDRVSRAERKRARAGLPGLHFLRADAGLFLEALDPAVRLADVYVLFPDPWPKLRHHKHRLMQPDFLTLLAARLSPGARLMFRTDHLDYFIAAQAMVATHPDWQLWDDAWPFEADTIFQQRAASHYSLVARPRPPTN